MSEKTLRSKPNEKPLKGDSAMVNDALDLKTRASDFREQEEGEWETITEEFEKTYLVDDTKGVRKQESSLLHLATTKTKGKLKMLDWRAHAQGKTDEEERIVTQGLINVAEKGGLAEAMDTAIDGITLLADSFIHLSIDKDNKYPIQFKNVDLDQVYVDPFASVIRSSAGLRIADEILVVYKTTLDQFNEDFKDFKDFDRVATGDLPGDEDKRSLSETDHEDGETEDNTLQVGYYYKKSKKVFGIIAGGMGTELLNIQGDEYPFMKDGEAYIPVVHLQGYKRKRGLYGYSLGHLLLQESRQQRRANNWSDWGMIENIKGIRMVDIPTGKAGVFWQKLRQAEQALAAGRQGIITMERGVGDQSQVRVDKFASDPVTQEIERFNAKHDLNVKRLGIPLDEVDRPASESATQTLAEETRADQFAQDFMKRNASQLKWMWELVIESIKEFVNKNDDTPLELTTEIEVGEDFARNALREAQNREQTPEEFELEVQREAQKTVKPLITMGMLKEELSNNEYFIKVNALSGVVKSPVRELSEIQTLIPFAQMTGDPAAMGDLAMQAASLLDREIKKPKPQAQLPGGQPGQTPQAGELLGKNPTQKFVAQGLPK